MSPALKRGLGVAVLAGGALAVVVAVVLLRQRGGKDEGNPPGPNRDHPPGFCEQAHEAGISFRMAFLPNEQGEHFKINLYDHGCGLAVGDYDGDGFDDIYFTNQLGPNALYRNKGDGTFEDVTDKAGVGLGDRICVAATFADYDNDGRQDLFVTSTRGGNVLFRNLGDGKFKDVTKETNLTCIAHCQTAAFFDYDGDSFLDLFVTCTAKWTQSDYDRAARYFPGLANFWEMAASPKEFNLLYHNNRNGTFTEVTEKAGVRGKGWGGDVAIFDYDDDGRLDLFVTNMFGASQLYHNQGGGTFADVTKEALGRTSWGAIGSKPFDFNNDGKLDFYLVDMHSDMWLPQEQEMTGFDLIHGNRSRKFPGVTGPLSSSNPRYLQAERRFEEVFQIKYADVVFGNTLFKNLGRGRFEEISDKANMETFWPWGVATGDFDNDGFEDVYLPSGMGYPYLYWPSALMMNNGDETFTDRAEAEGVEPPARGQYLEEPIGGRPASRSARCAATADFDHDGRLEIVTNNFNDMPYYYRNDFPAKGWIAFRLRGTRSNRDAIGAVVRLYAGKEVLVRQVQAAGGYLSHSSKTLHFGLGDRTIDRVEIRWPNGVVQKLDPPRRNTLHEVVEPSP